MCKTAASTEPDTDERYPLNSVLEILNEIMYIKVLLNSNSFYKLRSCFYDVQEFDV